MRDRLLTSDSGLGTSWALPVLASLLLAGSACGDAVVDGSALPSPHRVAVPAFARDTQMNAILTARLAGDADEHCLWLVGLSGRTCSAFWPLGFTASFDPIALYDPHGQRVANIGNRLEMSGGIVTVPVNYCRHGRETMVIGEITGVAP